MKWKFEKENIEPPKQDSVRVKVVSRTLQMRQRGNTLPSPVLGAARAPSTSKAKEKPLLIHNFVLKEGTCMNLRSRRTLLLNLSNAKTESSTERKLLLENKDRKIRKEIPIVHTKERPLSKAQNLPVDRRRQCFSPIVSMSKTRNLSSISTEM